MAILSFIVHLCIRGIRERAPSCRYLLVIIHLSYLGAQGRNSLELGHVDYEHIAVYNSLMAFLAFDLLTDSMILVPSTDRAIPSSCFANNQTQTTSGILLSHDSRGVSQCRLSHTRRQVDKDLQESRTLCATLNMHTHVPAPY